MIDYAVDILLYPDKYCIHAVQNAAYLLNFFWTRRLRFAPGKPINHFWSPAFCNVIWVVYTDFKYPARAAYYIQGGFTLINAVRIEIQKYK